LGKRIQKDTPVDQRDYGVQQTNNKTTRASKKGKREKPPAPPENLGNILAKTVKRFVPFLNGLFQQFPEHRQEGKLYYLMSHLLWSGIFMYLLLCGSKKQYRQDKRSDLFLKNLLLLSKTHEKTCCDPDTIEYFLKNFPYTFLETVPQRIVNHLIRIKSLDSYRFRGYFLIAMDCTGMQKYELRHCKHCLKSKDRKGKPFYYHPVLEAKLVTPNGFAFSIATEFIENPQEFPTKQDCEYNAFKRLAPKLKSYFPRLPFCLLLDALYLKQYTFELCDTYLWKYIITFKPGTSPSFYRNVWKEKQEKIQNRKTIQNKTLSQYFSWVNFMEYHENCLTNALFCHEVTIKKDQTLKVNDFAWITNLHELSFNNVDKIANQGGRLRWKIENEGFNVQKNGGYDLEHSYSHNNNASKCWYFLLQIAHALNQLMSKSNLFIDFSRQMGSLKNFAKRLVEHLRTILIDPDIFLINNYQIRFNSS